MSLVLGFLLGCIFAYLLGKYFLEKSKAGTLVVDISVSYSKPYLYAELSNDIDKLRNNKYVIMKVKKCNSHK